MMHWGWGWILLFVWVTASPSQAVAEAPGAGWQPDALLSRLMLRTLVQAPDGLLWVGTDDGVYRYDGTRLVPLNALRRQGPALPAVACDHLLSLATGGLWLGTEAGLYLLGADGRLRRRPLPNPQGTSRAVESLTLAPDGRRVWVGQRGGGLQAYSLDGRLLGLPLRTAGVYDVRAAPDGTLWANDPTAGLQHLAATGRVLGTWPTTGHYGRLVLDPTGRAWVLTAGGAYRPAPAGQWQAAAPWEPAARYPPEARVDLSTGPGGLGLLSRGQLRQLGWTAGSAPRPRVLFTLLLPPWPTAAWSGRLRHDQGGHWWLFDSGTRTCWRREAVPAFVRALPGPDGQPYSVRATVRLPNGRLLVSTYEIGLLTQAADSPLAPLRHWAAATLPTGNVPTLMGVVPAAVGPRGDWLAAGVSPLLRFNPRTGALREVPLADVGQGTPNGLCLARDPATGRVWAGSRSGLHFYDSTRQVFQPYRLPQAGPASKPAAPLAGRIVEDIWPDGRGHLWLATLEGVERLTLATGVRQDFGPLAAPPRRAPLDGARCLYHGPDGRLWVGTRTHGLLVIEPDGRARSVLTLGQGLPDASIASVLPGPGGHLWLGTYQGLVRYQPATGQLSVFTTAQGLASNECNARAAYVDPLDGHSLLIGGVAGLHRIYPGQMPGPRSRTSRLLLTGWQALSADAATSRVRYRLPADGPPPLALAPDAPLIDLHLALTNDSDPGRARYAYRVRGWLADRWLGLGTTPLLRLQGLPPGRYTVEIRAETSQGVPAANQLRLPLTVTAPWWSRPLTWVLAGLAAVAAVYQWQRRRLRQMQRDNALRGQLAADLHDEVGALLTRVTMQAELLHELEQGPPARLAALVADSRAAASTVRDIIWSVDTQADTLTALVDRIRDHLDTTSRATGRLLHLDEAALPPVLDRPLPPTMRQQVYLIFKEAVTNALKYARPDQPIQVVLRCASPLLELTVTSAGEAPAAGRAGQGLRNMSQRAARLGATLATGPVPGGWQVRLRVPG